MARYYDTQPDLRFVALDLSEQLRPGTFEHALSYLIDHQLDLSHFDACYRNDETGAPAYPPAMLLKIVLFGYSQGLLGSRRIARAYTRDATFIALRGDSQPHFTTLAHFVSTLDDDIATVFGAVLAICQHQGLIGAELFAIDGVKLPSNASKHKSARRPSSRRPRKRYSRDIRSPTTSRSKLTTAGTGPRRLTGCIVMPANCAGGWLPIQTTVAAPAATSSKATGPTTTAPRWPPTRASSRVTPRSLRSMPNPRSSLPPRPTAPVPSRHYCCPLSKRLRIFANPTHSSPPTLATTVKTISSRSTTSTSQP